MSNHNQKKHGRKVMLMKRLDYFDPKSITTDISVLYSINSVMKETIIITTSESEDLTDSYFYVVVQKDIILNMDNHPTVSLFQDSFFITTQTNFPF